MPANLQLGVLYALVSGTLWGIGPLLLKRGMTLSNVSTATLTQQCVSVTTLTLIVVTQGDLFALTDLSARAFWAFVAAGAIGASFGKIFYYKGIDKVGASRSISVKNSSPIFTTVLAVAILGENLTLAIAVGVVLIIIGIMVITRTEVRTERGPSRVGYLFYPFMAAICFGINPIFKKIGVDATNLPTLGALITQSTGLIMMLTAGRFLNIRPNWERVPSQSLLFFSLAGITEALASLFTFFALVYAPAVLVSPIWRISPLVTFVLAHFTLKGIEVVTVRDGVAASLIVGGVFVLSQS
ncbi:MAG: EamA family transporter [Candidatus Binatia bacterium]